MRLCFWLHPSLKNPCLNRTVIYSLVLLAGFGTAFGETTLTTRSLSTIHDANGAVHHIADLKEKKFLLLTFFPKCFTFNCANQLKSLRDHYKELQKANVEVWAVSTDPADGDKGQRAFAKHLNLPFPLLPDTDRKISLAFGAVQTKEQMAIRMSVLIDKEGKIVWVDKQIDPRNHGTDVLARIKAQLSGTIPAKVQ